MAINKVLVVDDSPAELTNIKSIVANTGCVVLSASNGQEAVEIAKKETPDIIFMDIIMPDMDGYEATRQVVGADAGRKRLCNETIYRRQNYRTNKSV